MLSNRLLTAAILLPLLALPLLADRDTDALFQKALVKESVERNLEAAIVLYQQTVGHPRVGPGVAGEARLRMGLCYEKIGKPQEAEIVYRQLLEHPTGVTPEIVQKAKVRLRQVEAENALGIVATPGSPPPKIIWVSRSQPTPLSFLLGPALAMGNHRTTAPTIEAGARWRLSPMDRPLHLYAQMQAAIPMAHAQVQNQATQSNALGTTSASLKLHYQTLLALVAELPHGKQQVMIPEIGAGTAFTASEITYTNAAFSGTQNETRWSPYLQFGVHVWPNYPLSFLVHASYTATPYQQSINVAGQTGNQSFGFPSSQWMIGIGAQWKVGYKHLVPELRK